MNPGSVWREVKPEMRGVTVTETVWFVMRSVMERAVPRITLLVSTSPVVFVIIFVVFPQTRFVVILVTCLVVTFVAGAIVAIPCLGWGRPSNENHCQKSGYCNLSDIFHFDPPFIRICRRGDKKGYRFINVKEAWRDGAEQHPKF